MIYIIGDTGLPKPGDCASQLSKRLVLRAKKKALLINTNKRRSFSLTQNKKLSYFDFKGSNLKKEIQNSAEVYDEIVVSCSFGENLLSALEVADQLIIPCDAQTPTMTVWTLTRFENVIDQVLESNSSLKAFYLMSNANVASNALRKTLGRSQYLSKFVIGE
jgi:hypothetical protein